MGGDLCGVGPPRRDRLPGARAAPLSAVRTIGLRKTYGARSALAGVDLVVPEGSLYGLVGPNGSGKTTLIEILAGLRRASGGEVDLGVGEGEVAYCPDVAEFEPWLTAAEVLEAALGLIDRRRPRGDLDVLLERVGLAKVAQRRVGGLLPRDDDAAQPGRIQSILGANAYAHNVMVGY
ncbi:ATP-binding cassette domain-containing protein [Ferrimicrobium acidiphilum]|uniref:ATP-binding cassette domain-containing protein n=1 Tax=Ferrimicrobium acidiphilum TaxID=121039 RepID=UPI0023F38001|nr:ATP-binding cassette domain-containing protein [Ferrimicrobium acidiphilum]